MLASASPCERIAAARPSASVGQTSLLRRSQVLNPLALDLGALQHRRDQFLLVAQDLGFLHLDLAFLLHLLHLHLLSRHLLQHDVGLQLVRLVGRAPAAGGSARHTRPS